MPLACGCERRKSIAPVDIAEHLIIGDTAAFADLGDDRLVGAVAHPEIEARRDCCIAVMGEFAGNLAGPFIPAGHVMDHDDAGMRAGIGRVRVIRIAAVAAMAAIGLHSRLYVAKRHVEPPSKSLALFAPKSGKSKPDIGRGCADCLTFGLHSQPFAIELAGGRGL